MGPLVSIVMPAKNVENYIAQAIDSALVQTYKNIEIVIADDFSTDNTRKIIDSYASMYNNIRVINGSGVNVNATRNILVSNSKGEFITMLDSDDIIDITRVEKLLSVAIRYNKAFIGSDLVYCDKNLIPFKVVQFPVTNKEIRKKLNRHYLFNRYGICTVGLGHRTVFENCKYREFYKQSGDFDFLMRLKKDKEIHFENVSEPLYYYRLNEKSMTINSLTKVDYDFLLILNNRKQYELNPITSLEEMYKVINSNLLIKLEYMFFKFMKTYKHKSQFKPVIS